MRGGTAESRAVPLRKKSDIREGRGQQGGGGAVGYTCRKYAGRDDRGGGFVCVDELKGSQPGGWGWRGRGQRGKIVPSINCRKKEKKLETTRKCIFEIKPAAGNVSLPRLFFSFVSLHSQGVHVVPRSFTRGQCCQRDTVAGGSRTGNSDNFKPLRGPG